MPDRELTTDLLREQARDRPGSKAVAVDGGRALTFGELQDRSSRLGRALVAAGVSAQDRVAILASNDDAPDAVGAHLAIHKAGAVAVPLNTRMSPAELAVAARQSASRLVLVSASLRGSPQADALHEVVDLGVHEAPGAPRECLGWTGPPGATTLLGQATQGGKPADPGASSGEDLQVRISPDDLADLLPTSGTTGNPKYVGATHRDALTLVRSPLPFPGTTYLHAVPLFTFTGAQALTLVPLASGMCQLVQSPFSPTRFLELIEGAHAAFMVPAMAVLCAKDPRFESLRAPDLKVIMLGTAATPPSAISAWTERLPETIIVNLYGLTEGGGAVCAIAGRELAEHPSAAGRPVPPAELLIVRPDASPCDPGEIGEVLLRQPGVRRSYVGDAPASATTFDTDGWVHTGDLGYVDDTGLLYVVDRLKDMVIRGGFNVPSAEVENVLLAHPDVLEAAVVGVPHEVLGEDLAAFIVLRGQTEVHGERPGPGAELLDELRSHAGEHLADYKVPRRIWIVDELPRNPTGKVKKAELRAEARRLAELEWTPSA